MHFSFFWVASKLKILLFACQVILGTKCSGKAFTASSKLTASAHALAPTIFPLEEYEGQKNFTFQEMFPQQAMHHDPTVMQV